MINTTIDLHGAKHEDVGRLLDAFIWKNMTKKSTGIKIIIGNSPKMKHIVKNIVAEYGFEVVEAYDNSASVMVDFI